jgi:mono/diheme cytochrome c family protein
MRTELVIVGIAAGLSLGLAGCNKAAPQQESAPPQAAGAVQESAPANAAPAAAAGQALYTKANCAMCHGDDRAGKALGPSLLSLQQNWTAEKLVAYFQDPQGYAANDQRLTEQKKQYSMKMPPPSLTADEIQVLAQWLLQQPTQ